MAPITARVTSQALGSEEYAGRSLGYVWNPSTLAYEVATAASASGGGAVTVVDGGDVAQGATTDAEAAAGNGTIVAILKRIRTLLSNPLAVTGTFFQATQPVSLATNTPDVTDRAGRLLGVIASVTAAIDVGDRAARLLGHVTVDNASIAVTLATNTPDVTDRVGRLLGIVASITNALPAGTNKIGTVDIATAPAVAKGTQGANGVPTQDLKDSGRVNIMWTAEFSPTGTAEALLTMTESRDGAAVTTFTTKVVTNGKRLRITSWTLTSENTLGANPKRNKVRMKFNTAGAVTTASPLQANLVSSVPGTVNTVGSPALDDFPDGIEFLGDGTKQIGFTNESPDWVTAAQTSKLYLTIFGYEY